MPSASGARAIRREQRYRSAPHRSVAGGHDRGADFDRTAFKVARIYVTLAADGRTANFKFAPDEQEMKCLVAADAFAPVPNAWGRQGWTTGVLAKLSARELRDALETAWRHALPGMRTPGRRPARRQ